MAEGVSAKEERFTSSSLEKATKEDFLERGMK